MAPVVTFLVNCSMMLIATQLLFFVISFNYCIQMLIDLCKQILGKPPKGLAIKDVRNLFFPYWKSVLSRKMLVKIIPTCQPSKKDLKSAETSRNGKIKSTRNLGSLGLPKVASNFDFRRTFCAAAWLSRKVLTRT